MSAVRQSIRQQTGCVVLILVHRWKIVGFAGAAGLLTVPQQLGSLKLTAALNVATLHPHRVILLVTERNAFYASRLCQASACNEPVWSLQTNRLGCIQGLQKPKRKPPFSSAPLFCLLLDGPSAEPSADILLWLATAALLKRLESPLERWTWHTLLNAASYTCRHSVTFHPTSPSQQQSAAAQRQHHT